MTAAALEVDSLAPSPEPLIARLTAAGRGALATIRFRGECSLIDGGVRELFHAANGRRLADQPIGRVAFGHWGHDPFEELVVCRRDALTLDIHCHGGDAATERVMADLESVGCRSVPWTELSTRAEGTLTTECLEALSRATTLRTAEILLDQSGGVLRAGLESLASVWPSESDESSSHAAAAACDQIDALLHWADFGRHLTVPWRVVLFGQPNVGKSSLINALVGYSRSIVYDEPGTTRDVVTAETAFQGWPVQLADTAGLRPDARSLEAEGIERTRTTLATADLRLLLVDIGSPPGLEVRELLEAWSDALVIAHKSDLTDAWGDLLPWGAVPVSSLTGSGLSELADKIVERLVPTVPVPGTPIPVTDRQVELLRSAREALVAGDAVQWRTTMNSLVALSPSLTGRYCSTRSSSRGLIPG